MGYVTDAMRRRRVRARMVAYGAFLFAHRGSMPYVEARPMRSFHTAYMHVPAHATDCSESTAMIARAAGAPTPYVVDNAGFTGTMLGSLPHIPLSQTRRGDFVVFVHPDRPTGDHVVMLMQGGRRHRDPIVWSHGSPGVFQPSLTDEWRFHPGSHIVCLKTVPDRYSKADKRKALAA